MTNPEMIEEIDGMVSVGDTVNDFTLEGDIELPPLFKQNDIRYEYNQGKTKHCTLYSAFGALSDLTDYQLTDKDIQEIIYMSITRGKPVDQGRSTQLGVKLVCDWRNEKHPDDRVIYYRIDVVSNNYLQVLKNGYTAVMSFRGNSDYSIDHWTDGVVDGLSFPNPTRGHATTSVYLKDNKIYIKDSYKGRKQENGKDDNYYQLKDIVSLVKNAVFYPSAYVILKENDIKPNIEDLKRLKALEVDLNSAIAINSKLWHSTNDDVYRAELENMNNINRAKVQDVKNEENRLIG